MRAIGDRLLDADMEVALQASRELRALGAEAAPALPPLLLALERELSPNVARLHWHPWMGMIRELHVNVIATIQAIGPRAGMAVPVLAARLERAGRPHARELIAALLAVGPEKDETLRVLVPILPKVWTALPRATRKDLCTWIESRGTSAIPILVELLDRVGGDDRNWVLARLASCGDEGLDALLNHLDSLRPMEAKTLINLYVKRGFIPVALVPQVARLYAQGEIEDADAVFAALATVVKDEDAFASDLADALARVDPSQRPWRSLWSASPALARKVSVTWFAGRRPADGDGAFDDAGLRRTSLRGGRGGGSFDDRRSVRATLVGLRVWSAKWSGHTIVTAVQPIFGGPEGIAEGAVHGQARGTRHTIASPKGYAIGGLYVRGGHRVDGLAAVFLPWSEKGLALEGAFVGPWVGGTSGGGAVLLGATGHRVVGLHGRKGADLDAVGLIEARE